jgi:hypothetical protein
MEVMSDAEFAALEKRLPGVLLRRDEVLDAQADARS